jgi:hypothetical protein
MEMKNRKQIPRRTFIGIALAATGLARVSECSRSDCGEILEQSLKRCSTCDRLRGHVEERWNGQVPVLCRCDLRVRAKKKNPAMVSLRDDGLMWMPITDHKVADGRWLHTPYFAGLKYY